MATSRMHFNVGVVRDFLESNGHVVTVRGYDYKTKTATVPQLGNARIIRKLVCEIKTTADLAGFLPLSGFSDVGIWARQVKQFCKDGRMFLYLVKIATPRPDRPQQQLNFSEPVTVEDRALHRREDTDPSPLEEYIAYRDSLKHPTDAQKDPAIRDPALIDLSSYRDAAQQKRDADARRTTQVRRDAYAENRRTQQRPTPEAIMSRSPAELFLCEMARGT